VVRRAASATQESLDGAASSAEGADAAAPNATPVEEP
jgi:hypothetical protein